MSDNYPWFKFDAESWLSGSVQFQPPEYQSVFINIASLYWKNKRPVTKQEISVRYPRDKQMVADALQSLADACLITVGDGDSYTVDFLTEQMSDNDVKSDKKRDAANKRWGKDKDSIQVHACALQNDADKNREDKTRTDKSESIDPEDPFNGLPPKLNTELNFNDWKYTDRYTQLRKLSCRPTEKTWLEWISLIEEHGLQSLTELLSDIDKDKRYDPNCIIIKPQFGSSDGLKTNANGEIIL